MTRLGLHPTAYGNRGSFGQKPVRKSTGILHSETTSLHTERKSGQQQCSRCGGRISMEYRTRDGIWPLVEGGGRARLQRLALLLFVQAFHLIRPIFAPALGRLEKHSSLFFRYCHAPCSLTLKWSFTLCSDPPNRNWAVEKSVLLNTCMY